MSEYIVVVRHGEKSTVHRGKDLRGVLRRAKRAHIGERELIGWNLAMDAYLNQHYGKASCSQIAAALSKLTGKNVTKNAVISRYHYQRHKRNLANARAAGALHRRALERESLRTGCDAPRASRADELQAVTKGAIGDRQLSLSNHQPVGEVT